MRSSAVSLSFLLSYFDLVIFVPCALRAYAVGIAGARLGDAVSWRRRVVIAIGQLSLALMFLRLSVDRFHAAWNFSVGTWSPQNATAVWFALNIPGPLAVAGVLWWALQIGREDTKEGYAAGNRMMVAVLMGGIIVATAAYIVAEVTRR